MCSSDLKTCDFRSGRVILQRSIEREQMEKLLSAGKTDLLHKFISKKGRPFSAYLAKGADGKVGFEFAPRKGATPKTSTSRTNEANTTLGEVANAPVKPRTRRSTGKVAAKKSVSTETKPKKARTKKKKAKQDA